jgi:hypothetical protein
MHTTLTPTPSFRFSTDEQYQHFIQTWKKLAKAKTLTAAHLALHALVLNKPLWFAFSPITNVNKLANGAYAWDSVTCAMCGLRRGQPVDLMSSLTSEESAVLATLASNVSTDSFTARLLAQKAA